MIGVYARPPSRPGVRRWRRTQQPAGILRRTETDWREHRRRSRTHDDLAGFGDLFHERGLGCGWAGNQQLAVAVTDQEEVEGATADADGHLQRHHTDGGA